MNIKFVTKEEQEFFDQDFVNKPIIPIRELSHIISFKYESYNCNQTHFIMDIMDAIKARSNKQFISEYYKFNISLK